MSLKHSYTVLAPVYDALVSKPLEQARKKSIASLPSTKAKHILLNGLGTGLDIPFLPTDAVYTGIDITPAMLSIAQERALQHPARFDMVCGDSQQLPFNDHQFDIILMHLILAVVPHPETALMEACRVLKPGGGIFILDKFLKPGQLAPIRKIINVISRHIATRTDVVFEETIKYCPELTVINDEAALAKGWFRLIELRKE